MFEVVAAKLHGVKVTECDLNYHGSITIDAELLERAGMPPGIFVYVWNKQSGKRLSTYTLPGPRGKREICLNGAAARSCQIGDELIITLSKFQPMEEIRDQEARVLTFSHSPNWNEIDEELVYQWDAGGSFRIAKAPVTKALP